VSSSSFRRFRPLSSPWSGGTVKSFSEIAQVLLGVKAVNDLGGIRKLIVGDIPDPGGAIPEHDPT